MNIAGQGGIGSGFELRPRRAGELMDVAFRLTRHAIHTMWPVMLAVLVPVSALAAVQIASLQNAASARDFTTSSNGQSGLSLVSTIVVGLLVVTLVPAMYAIHMGAPISSGDALRHGLRRVPIAILYAILSSLALLGLMVPTTIVFVLAFFAIFAVARITGPVGVIVVAAISYLATFIGLLGLTGRFQLGFIALIIEYIGPVEALKRGFSLTKRRWLQYGALQALMLILIVIFGVVAGGVGAAVFSAIEGSIGIGIVAFAGYLLYLGIWFPMYTALGVAMYVDSRVRLEALDIGQLSSQLSSPTLLG